MEYKPCSSGVSASARAGGGFLYDGRRWPESRERTLQLQRGGREPGGGVSDNKTAGMLLFWFYLYGRGTFFIAAALARPQGPTFLLTDYRVYIRPTVRAGGGGGRDQRVVYVCTRLLMYLLVF